MNIMKFGATILMVLTALAGALVVEINVTPTPEAASVNEHEGVFEAGVHYVELDTPVATRVRDKVEVVEAFSYGCSHGFGNAAWCHALKLRLSP